MDGITEYFQNIKNSRIYNYDISNIKYSIIFAIYNFRLSIFIYHYYT